MSAKREYFIGIDPSIRELGYAIIRDDGVIVNAVHITNNMEPSKYDYVNRATVMARNLIWNIKKDSIDFDVNSIVNVIIEVPSVRLDRLGVGTLVKGDVQKLYYFVGLITSNMIALGRRLNGFIESGNIVLTEPNCWKGSETKSDTRERLLHTGIIDEMMGYGANRISDDVCDAIGIATAYRNGYLLVPGKKGVYIMNFNGDYGEFLHKKSYINKES